MIHFSRALAKQFLQVLRKAGLLKPVRMNLTPCVRLIAERESLTLQAMDVRLSVAWTVPAAHEPATLIVPLQLLADCTQRTEGDVVLVVRNGRLLAQWTDRGVPIDRDYDLIEPDQLPQMPAPPTEWQLNSPRLLEALRDAMRSTDPDSTRYALGCVQLQGAQGRIAATDGRQAFVHGGFQFPWPEDLLIPATKVFESPVLPHDSAVQIGRTEQHVVLQVDAWTIAFTIQTEGRFPDVERIMPAASAVRTWLQLHPADIEFLAQRLDQLPHDDELHHPVTVDLNGDVAIRSRRSVTTPPAELLLRRSQREGDEVRLQTDRRLLKRALNLGFTEIGFTSNEGPAVCRDETRQFVWAVLDAKSAVPASDDVRQIDSFSEPVRRKRVTSSRASVASHAMTGTNDRHPENAAPSTSRAASPKFSPSHSRMSPMPKKPGSVPTETELITQLLDLRAQLRVIETSVVTIARQLRARRKQQQLMKSTLASLKQLQTLGV